MREKQNDNRFKETDIMLCVRNITFESDNDADVAMSRLDWKVEKVSRLVNPLFNHSTTDTARPWVGRIDKDKKEFRIIQTAPYFSPRILEGNFFQLFVHGRIIDEEQKSKIILKFRLGINTLMLFIVTYTIPVLVIARIDSQNWEVLSFAFTFPALLTLLLVLQLNKTENKLIDLFGV